MKFLILGLLLVYIGHMKRASAAELSLTQGFAYHYRSSKNYNDSVFRDNKTSTNSLATLSFDRLDFTLLSDSQGDLSGAVTHRTHMATHRLLSLDLIAGVYIIRNDGNKVISELELPSVDFGHRSWTFTPLFGVEAKFRLTNRTNVAILATPAFTLGGIQWTL